MVDIDQAVILADWGNSSGRIYCVRGPSSKPEILENALVSGAKETNDCAALFASVAKPWIKSYDVKQAFFTGAVTSNIGWMTTKYAPIPARLSDVTQTSVRTEYDLPCTFLSGTSIAKGPHGYFDTVRGEDMQAYGWMALTGQSGGLLCAPGTHTKWLTLEDGAIMSILTGVTGESFEVFHTHSMLTRGAENPSCDTPEFDRGLNAMMRLPRPALTHMLMSVRNLQLSGGLSPARSADYLSGLLTGEDCVAAHERLPEGPIHIIGDGSAAGRYAAALTKLGRSVEIYDGQACVIAGLQAVRRRFA
jgi:2-dehydro-3-deoxygalactonokinase